MHQMDTTLPHLHAVYSKKKTVDLEVTFSESPQVGRDLDPDEEHRHHVPDHHSRDPERREWNPNAPRPILVQRKIH